MGRGRSVRHGDQGRARGNLALRLGLVLLVAVMFSVHLMGGLLAKYASSDGAAGGARVAAFSFDLSDYGGGHAVDLVGIGKPGDSRSFRFSVRNGGETSVRYWISAELNGSMPVVLDVRRRAGESWEAVLSTNLDDLGAAIEESRPLTKRTEAPVVVGPNDSEVQVYEVTATWPGDECDAGYAEDSVGELVVSVLSEQVD